MEASQDIIRLPCGQAAAVPPVWRPVQVPLAMVSWRIDGYLGPITSLYIMINVSLALEFES